MMMMQFKEFKSKYPEMFKDGYEAKWAEDSKGGFGRKGWSVYGDDDRLFVAWVDLKSRTVPAFGLVQEQEAKNA